MARTWLTRIALVLSCISLACSACLVGCGAQDRLSADRLKESLQTTLSAFNESDDAIVEEIASSVDSKSLDSLGMSAEDVAGQVMSGLGVDVGDVKVEGDVAVAQVYLKCKNISEISESIKDLAKKYSSSPKNLKQSVAQLTKEANDLIASAESEEIGPIYLEYFRADEGWVLSDESRERLGSELVGGMSPQE